MKTALNHATPTSSDAAAAGGSPRPARGPDIALLERARPSFDDWEVLKDVVDESIDLMLNHRQSGHPGGSRSKVHLLLSTLLSGAMRWDIRRPWAPFQDRFVLSAGHTVPLVYATLAVLDEVMRARVDLDADDRFAFPASGQWALGLEDLLRLRRRGGLPGHAEMAGRTMFLKFNTGPSGHGMPPAAGEALALKLAGLESLKVFVVEGEGGLTPGASHETKNTAWGLGLSNLVFLLDWNDFGIDDFSLSSVVAGTPESWFAPYGWRVFGAPDGMSWEPVTAAVLAAARRENPDRAPSVAWVRTRKGRGYGKYDNKSHGVPHPRNSPEFWAIRRAFMERRGVEYEGVDEAAPADEAAREAQTRHNLAAAFSVIRRDPSLVRRVSDRLVEVAADVDRAPEGFNLAGSEAIFDDPAITDFHSYPAEVFKKPGESAPNRAGLASWGSWMNAYARERYGRPLVIACSADLADSTNISGFAKDFGDKPGWGWYSRDSNPRGAVLPTEITEFTNAGLMAGMASVNVSDRPFETFNGFWGACSTYGSFSYLKYGAMRLFTQLAQDSPLKLGKVIWVAGHSGPETADDSRTHFGIFETGVTQLFPPDAVIDVHPWEFNEVPVVLGAALATDAHVVALHLTRPPIALPDRDALRIPSHFDAARGAYLLRDYRPGERRDGAVFVQGTTPVANLCKVLPEIDRRGWNLRIVCVISPQLFRAQPEAYRAGIVSPTDRWDAMAITNRAFKLMADWVEGAIARDYSLSADWDDRWRTGGTLEEVMDEAHLTEPYILDAIERFVRERGARRERMREALGD